MISYLQIEKLTKSFGDRLMFADVTFGVYEGDKIALVARNGAGKSTFLNIVCGKEDYDSGAVVFRNGIRVGYLEQSPVYDPAQTIISYCTPTPRNDDDWDAPDRARRMLTQFGINDADRTMQSLSGGEVKRIALAKVLLSEPDMLVLDEPTNHLDIDMTEWLENYLGRQRVTLLLVTHDRYFLDRVCNKIVEIDDAGLFVYEGNFDYYLARRSERIEARTSEMLKIKNLLRTESEWMSRQPQARGSKAKYRIDNFHQLEEKSRYRRDDRDVALRTAASYIGSKIFSARGITKSFGDKKIIENWDYDFARYEKVGIVGGNGVGKSTFIKMLLGCIEPDSGRIDVGQTVRWGYYSQDGIIGFDESKKVIDAVREIAEEVRIDEKTRMSASQFLGMFLFSVADQQKFIHKLSGGERRRLYLATVLMKSPNFLVLDEPTNDLDVMTLAVLEDYLANFKGCVIVISHDRFFLDRIADHLFVFEGEGKVRDFPGDYSTYRHCVHQQRREQCAAEESCRKEKVAQTSEKRTLRRKVTLSFKEKQEMRQLESDLERYSEEKAMLEKEMSTGEMEVSSLMAASERVSELIGLIDSAEMRYLELLEKES